MVNLTALPEELLQQIADLLDRTSQKNFALVNWTAWEVATNALWRDVKLIDKRTQHHISDAEHNRIFGEVEIRRNKRGLDEHDDAPLLRKLLILASNKRLARKVRVLTHRCHLPLPAIFDLRAFVATPCSDLDICRSIE